jgi:hypothetical protein
MRRRAVTLVLAVLACNAGDRGEGPLSGSAGLSAGEGAETSGSGSAADSDDDGESGAGSSGAGPADTSGESSPDAGSTGATEGTTGSDTGSAQTGDTGGLDTDAGSESSGGLADGVLDVVVTAHDDCTFTTDPASITVPEGTEFTVNWVSSASSEVEFDVAKIDAFNAVPIILGMEPGTSYHDEVREWCGDLFTGTFDFRVTSCYDHHYIPVDCGG